MTTPYDVLGISADADDETIRRAFRKAAKQFHPDLNAGNSAAERHFRRVIAARAALSNPRQRGIYDGHVDGESQRWRSLWRDARSRIIACVLAGAAAAGILFAFSDSSPEPIAEGSSLEALVEVPKTSVSEEAPDAEFAEIKSMRDRRETPGADPAQTYSDWSIIGGNSNELMLSRPMPGGLAAKHRSKPKISNWQREAPKSISKRLITFWRQIEAKIQSVKLPKT